MAGVQPAQRRVGILDIGGGATQDGRKDPALLGFRIATARPGDTISSLLGSNEPGAIGRFLAVNGLTDQDSTIYAGRSYAIPQPALEPPPLKLVPGGPLSEPRSAGFQGPVVRASKPGSGPVPVVVDAHLSPHTDEAFAPEPGPIVRTPSPAPSGRPSALDMAAISAAGSAGLLAGDVVGVGRGAWNAGKGVVDGAKFGVRLLNPSDAAHSAPGDSAWDNVRDARDAVLGYAKSRATDPRQLASDIGGALSQMNVALNPEATPMAGGVPEEFQRTFRIGKNQGELAFDAGTILYGGALADSARALSAASKEAQFAADVATYGRRAANRLAKPYKGVGHHQFIPMRATRPENPALGLAFDYLRDSRFNVLKPSNLSTGEFYALHAKVDPYVDGFSFPRSIRGRWSARKSGVSRYGPLGSLWYGTPLRTKIAAYAAPATMAGLTYGMLADDNQ